MELAEIIAKAIYEQPTNSDGLMPKWENLSRQQKSSWMADAERVKAATKRAGWKVVKESLTTQHRTWTGDEQMALLLTVARILRSRIPEMSPSYQKDDLDALNEALAPFDPIKGEPTNQSNG